MTDVFWKGLVTAGILVGLAAGITTCEEHIASSKDLVHLEAKVVTTLDSFQKKIFIQFDMTLLERINQELIVYRRLMRENPDDYTLVEEYERLRESKKRVQERINKRLK